MEDTIKTRSKKWFVERIGKRIYRDVGSCACSPCKEVEENGLIVMDEYHALYLYDVQNDMASEGEFLNYRDEK